MNSRTLWLVGIVAVIVMVAPASAAPVQWPVSSGGNGHSYEFISNPSISWTDANVAASELTYAGVPGYLMTVTSAAENAFVSAQFGGTTDSALPGWIGGYQDTSAPDYSEPAGGWRWVTGESWSYTNWYTPIPQPDNYNGNQNYLRVLENFGWDDLQNDRGGVPNFYGYYVEFSTPEPGALALLAVGGISLPLWRRRGGNPICRRRLPIGGPHG
jgi:hypothetical protein